MRRSLTVWTILGALWASSAVLRAQTSADEGAAAAELERVEALIEAGALPRQALDEQRAEEEIGLLKRELRGYFSRTDLTRNEANQMLEAASRLLQAERERFQRKQKLVEAGAAPLTELEPASQDYEFVQKQFELAKSRADLVREMAAMASAEARLDELEEEELAFAWDGGGTFLEEDILFLDAEFYGRFGKPLPFSAEGGTVMHRSLGFDHTGRYDVPLSPDEEEGQFVIAVLESWGIPFVAFRSAVPGQSTGPHIHIGPPSVRVAAEEVD